MRTAADLPAVGWLRADLVQADRGDAATGAAVLRAGGGPALGGRGHRRAAFLIAGVEHRTAASSATALAGAGSAADQTSFFLQLGSQLELRGSLDPASP